MKKILFFIFIIIIVGMFYYLFLGKNMQNKDVGIESIKKEVIDSILNKQSIMASKDVSKIREYELKINTDNPVIIKKISGASDAEILSAAKIIENASLTLSDLNNPTTTFQINEDNAVVTVTRSGGDRVTTVKLKKIDGVWY